MSKSLRLLVSTPITTNPNEASRGPIHASSSANRAVYPGTIATAP
ncbi:hypothetical protein [Dactylosporangium aurantiacum]|nr:hypothetical protein [Dactylosporangium aurantiacum]